MPRQPEKSVSLPKAKRSFRWLVRPSSFLFSASGREEKGNYKDTNNNSPRAGKPLATAGTSTTSGTTTTAEPTEMGIEVTLPSASVPPLVLPTNEEHTSNDAPIQRQKCSADEEVQSPNWTMAGVSSEKKILQPQLDEGGRLSSTCSVDDESSSRETHEQGVGSVARMASRGAAIALVEETNHSINTVPEFMPSNFSRWSSKTVSKKVVTKRIVLILTIRPDQCHV